jgi:hypothetical protein
VIRIGVPAALALLALALLVPARAAAHIGGEASLIVPVDFVMPGQAFPVLASDLGSDAQVKFRLVQTERTVELGTVTAGPDGHFETNFALPADWPHGYAELIASSDDGSGVSTWILVGPRTESTPAPPNRLQWWQDPALLLLSAGLAAGGLILAVMTIRSARRERAVLASTTPPRRQPVRRKARRR